METSVNNKCKAFTSLEQSHKLAEILPLESADMCYLSEESLIPKVIYNGMAFFDSNEERPTNIIPCWSLAALLGVLPKEIYRKDKIHNGMAYVPCYKWEINPNAIFYTDGINTMDYTYFGYGENGVPLLDAAFIAICWLKNKGYLKTEKK